MSEAKWAFGTALLKGAVPIAELTNINGLDLDSDEIDVTHHQSPGGYEEIIQSIRRTGVVTLEGNFVPDDPGQEDLMADYLSGVRSAYTIDFSGAGLSAEWNFDAYVKKAPSTEAPVDGKIPFSAELRVTGQPSLDIDYAPVFTAITTSAGTLIPTFANDVFQYYVEIAAASTDIGATGTGTIFIEGAEVASATISLGIGETRTVAVESRATGEITRRAKVQVSRVS